MLDRDLVAQARTRARRTRRPHNDAKRTFIREVTDQLARREVDRVGRDLDGRSNLLDRGDLADVRAGLRADPDLRAALDDLWPTLSPPQLLADLWTSPQRLRAATRGWRDADRDLLARDAPPADPFDGAWWSPADAVLLDEVAELLGEDDTAAREAEERKREADEAYAAGVLEILAMEEDWDPELLRPTDVVDASVLADRTREATYASAAERAADDRTWTFGHVIVDEAQELSPMAWRVLMRRCPSRSMTLVGDVAQTGARAGASSWGEVLSPYVKPRWRREVLTVNYRTPAEIMAVAADVLAEIDPSAKPPESVRESGLAPRAVATDEAGLVDATVAQARAGPRGGRRRRGGGPRRRARARRPGGRAGRRPRGGRRADGGRRRRSGRRPRGGGRRLRGRRRQGPRVRRGRPRRPGRRDGRLPARSQRSVRGPHPGHTFPGRGASGPVADGARPPRVGVTAHPIR